MKNIEIVKYEMGNKMVSWLVYADTERFGEHEIMAQCISEEEAIAWVKENTEAEEKSAMDYVEEEIEKAHGKIQIGNVMYHYPRIENNRVYGHSGTWGWRDITNMINDCKMVSNGIGKSREYVLFMDKTKGYLNRTVKFGDKCTW